MKKKKSVKKAAKKVVKKRPTKKPSKPVVKKTPIEPLADRVLVKLLSEKDREVRRPSGIIIPETVDKERPYEGKVVAVGRGKYEDGKLTPVSVKVGDRVMFSKYGGDDVKIDGVEYTILREDQILAILN